MRFVKKISSKKVGAVLAVIFIISLTVITVYTRGYAEMQKPLVQIAYPQSGTATWTYELRSTIERASEEYAEFQGVEWTVTVYIPFAAFSDYANELLSLEAYAISDNVLMPERLAFLRRIVMENGDHEYVFSYASEHRQGKGQSVWPGEAVTVQLTSHFYDSYDYLLPFTALSEDSYNGELFLFSVARREGAWGREYVATRHVVNLFTPERIGDLANVLFIPSDDPIIVLSDQPLYDGAIVRIYD